MMTSGLTSWWTLLLAGAVVGILAYLFIAGIARGLRRSFGAGSEAGEHKADLLKLRHDEVKARNEQLMKEQESLLERRRALSEMNEMLLMQKQELVTQAQELSLSIEEYERLGQLTAWQQEELAERNEALERQTAMAEQLSKELAKRVDELNRAMAQIDRMHRDQEAFLRHELRNAISPILGYSAMLRSEAVLEGDAATWMEGIREAAESMERLLTELRDLQAIERGGKTIGQSEIDLDDLVLSSVRTVDPAGSHAIETRVEPVVIRGDPMLLPGVFVNLIRNAVEHVSGRPGTGVSVDTRADGRWATVRIQNGGPPIPEARLATFFERFNSTKEGGTGLGTCYADLVVRAHGGTVEVESGPYFGTVVTVRLPLARDIAPEPSVGSRSEWAA